MLGSTKQLKKFHLGLLAANFNYCNRNLHKSSSKCQIQVPKHEERRRFTTNTNNANEITSCAESDVSNVPSLEPLFPQVVHEVKHEIDFWDTKNGLELKDKLWTVGGRFLRIFILTKERYDNWWETAMSNRVTYLKRKNKFNVRLSMQKGPEVALGIFTLKLNGALKFVSEEQWVDNAQNVRFLTNNACAIEAIDLRNSILSYDGMKYFDEVTDLKYLNVADSPTFDNYCMTKLHAVAHSLEYLDISGTSVTPEAFTYFRLFSRLRWLNISRLSNFNKVESILPYLREILPRDCVIVCNDVLLSESYGTDISGLLSNGSSKDLVKENVEIGNLDAFNSIHNFNVLQVNDVSTIYQLWKTPKIDEIRRKTLARLKPRKKSTLMTTAEYAWKAEQFKPLF